MKIIATLLLALAGCDADENLRQIGDRRLGWGGYWKWWWGGSYDNGSGSDPDTGDDTPDFPPVPYNPYDYLPPCPEFTLTSAEIVDGGFLPIVHASGAFGVQGGQDVAPSLSWSDFPAETQSFVVTMYDPDAPTVSGAWHWAAYDIPASVTSLPLGGELPPGAIGVNNIAGFPGYVGAGPPIGRTHRYIFCVSALPVAELPLDSSLTVIPELMQFFMFNTGVIGRACLTNTFSRDE